MTALTRRSLLGGAAVATVAAASSLTGMPARAVAPMAGKQGPSFYRYKVGDFEVTALNEGSVRNANPANMALNKTLPDIQKALGDAFLPTDHVINQFNVVVVNTGKNLVLFDSGFGDNGAPTVGNLLSNMNAAGIDPKAIDTILVSHFHGDHINGIRAKAGAANFPNAEIMVPAAEWKHWTDAGEESRAPQVWKGNFGAVKRVFDPIAKDVKQFEFGKELVPGITSVDARGHSPGHTAFVMASGNAKLMYIADVTNHPILFARNPEWRLWADMIPDQALSTRRKLLDMLAAERMPMAGYHYPFPAVGYIAKLGNGYDFVPANWNAAF